MKLPTHGIALLLFLFGCAGDIKGDKGDTGADGTDGMLIQKPVYVFNPSDSKQIIVPVNFTGEAKVFINNVAYTNTTDAILDMNITGRGGLESGSISMDSTCYLYAIPAESGSTFELVASTFSPILGPQNFEDWSYLGAFRVTSSGRVLSFAKVGDLFLMEREELVAAFTNDAYVAYTVPMPATAHIVKIGFDAHAVSTDPDQEANLLLSLDGVVHYYRMSVVNNSSTISGHVFVDAPVTDPSGQIWYGWDDIPALPGSWNADLEWIGWYEDVNQWP